MPTSLMSEANSRIGQKQEMLIEEITLLVSGIGALLMAFLGVYKAASGQVKPGGYSSPTKGASSGLTGMRELKDCLSEVLRVLNEARRLLEVISNHQKVAVGDLESIERTMDRIESRQVEVHRVLNEIKRQDEAQVAILGQIRDNTLKRSSDVPPYRTQ